MGTWLVFDSIDDSLLSYKSYKIISESSLAKSQYKIAWNIHGFSILCKKNPEKSNNLNFKKRKKRHSWVHFGPLSPNFGQKSILNIKLNKLLSIHVSLPSCKKKEYLINRFRDEGECFEK